MKIVKNATFWSLLILISLADSGCSKKDEEVDRSEAKSAFYVKVKKEADQKEPDKLRIEVMKYKEEITAKMLEAEELRTKLQTVPFEEILEEDARRLEELNESISALKTRYDVYLQELRNKGEDLSDLEI
jgi:predicted  nucleic acid-binding Zn-ribbon protein